MVILAAVVLTFLLLFVWMTAEMNNSPNPDGYILNISILSTIFSIFIILAACLVVDKKGNPNELYRQKYLNGEEGQDAESATDDGSEKMRNDNHLH